MKYLWAIPLVFLLMGCEEISSELIEEPGESEETSMGIDMPVEAPVIPIDVSGVSDEFISKVERTLPSSRYMERNCEDSSYPGWEDFPVIRCEYTMRDGAQAPVYMLNAGPIQLVAWLKDACEFIEASDFEGCLDNLYRSVRLASGAQFAIAGIVYEDLDGDGNSEAYPFRDGVTVKISGISTGTEETLTEAQIINAQLNEVVYTARYARIASTSREQYYAYMSHQREEAVDVGGSAFADRKNTWMDVIRESYQEAWGGNINLLLRAWALANKNQL